MKRKIMGPCWLQIKQPHVEYKGVGALEHRGYATIQVLLRFPGASSK